jgi:hypothetical protein
MNSPGKRCSRAGVSLVEILLAAGILAAVMVPVMITFGSSNRGIIMTADEFLAHTAAIELLEQTMAVPFAMLPTGNFTNEQIQDGKPIDLRQSPLKFRVSEVPGLVIEREVDITPLLDAQNRLRFKKVDVRVRFSPADGKTKARVVDLKGLLANEEQ